MEEITQLKVEGMTCAHCAQSIGKLLERKGATHVQVSFTSGDVSFSGKTDLADVVEGISGLGYTVVDRKKPGPRRRFTLEARFAVALFFTIPLWLHMIPGTAFLHRPAWQLAACLPVMAVGVVHFGRSAWGSVKALDPNMDVLIILGSSMAFLYSVIGMVLYGGTEVVHRYLFFETASTIITFVLLGNIIEKRSLRRTVSILEDLNRLRPERARIVRHTSNGGETLADIAVEDIRINDILALNTGDRIPADGRIVDGSVSVDESMLTGESVPAEKNVNETVMAGTVIVDGTARMRAEKTAAQTVLSGVIELVRNAQASKPRLQRLGDKVSSIFVPSVIAVAAIAFVINYFFSDAGVAGSLMRAIAVLVVSCPCAMGLATPTAVSVGIGRAARNSILVRSGEAMETLSGTATVVFDKTGTLTTGRFRVKRITCYGTAEDEIRRIVAGLERHSSHPIARSLVAELDGQPGDAPPVSFTDISEEKGFGMRATGPGDRSYAVGSKALAGAAAAEHDHAVYVVIDGELAAGIDLEDEPRAGASDVVRQLRDAGMDTVLLSGDSEAKSRSLATAVGIEHVYSQQLPHQKTEVIARLRQKGPVAMVGDGINDAPSLALADTGISFGEATGIARNAAQVILLNNRSLAPLITALKTSRATVVTIRQNLFWAFFYNVLMIPLAAAGFLNPMIASLSMAFSDVVVIGNSVRLRYRSL